MDDEPIIKTRLMLDERGLLKRCALNEQLLMELDHHFRKHRLVQRANKQEVHRYQQESEHLEREKARAAARIVQLQRELERAKQERQHKLEYDALAAKINQLPARTVTMRRTQSLAREQDRLRALMTEQDALYEQRKRRLHQVFQQFEAVQEHFKHVPSLSESTFYGGGGGGVSGNSGNGNAGGANNDGDADSVDDLDDVQ